MSSNKTQAVQDLIWLSERLSGVIALKEELTNHDDLTNQLSELSGVVESSREELKSILEQKVSAQKDISDLLNQNAAIAADYKSRGDKLIQDSRLAADDLLEQLKSDVLNKQAKAEVKLQGTHKLIESLKLEEKDIKDQISQLTQKRNTIIKELDDVKNRI